MGSDGGYDFNPLEHPFVDKDLRFDQFQSFDCGTVHLLQIGHGYSGSSSCISGAGWRCSIPCLPASCRIGVHEVVLSLHSSQEWIEGPSCT